MPYRLLLTVALALFPRVVGADEIALPPGAVLQLGDARFRAGGPVTDLRFSADGTEITSRVAVDGTLSRIVVWDVATGIPIRAATELRRAGTRFRWGNAIVPDGPRGVVVDPDGVAIVRDFQQGKDLVRLTGHFARVGAVAVSPDGRRIATASDDGLIRVWDAATFHPIVEPRGHTAAVRRVEVSPDGHLALTTGADRTVRVWNLATGRELRAFPTSGDSSAGFTADGAAVRVTAAGQTAIRDLVTGLEVLSDAPRAVDPFAGAALAARQLGICFAISPDGRAIAVGRQAGSIDVYEVASGRVRRRLPVSEGSCLDLAFTPDGTKLLSAGSGHAVIVWAMRLRELPLPAALKRETSAAKLWDTMAEADPESAYLAMARLAVDPVAATRMAQLRLTAGVTGDTIGDVRAVELLESIGSREARLLLRELGQRESARLSTREARGALTRLVEPRDTSGNIRTTGGTNP